MELLERNRDMLLNNEDLEPLHTFQRFPIYMGVTDQPCEQDEFADMEWVISNSSGMVQLRRLVPDEILYKHSHNSGYGKIWQEHYQSFSAFIDKHSNFREGVLELGGGNGILCATFQSLYGQVPWIIVEPSDVEPVGGCTATYIRNIWNSSFDTAKIKNRFGVLIHSHVLEHLLDLNDFMKQCAKILTEGQRMIFSVPNLKETLARKYTNALNFEHTYLITEEYIDYILEKYGFRIIEKQLYREEHSIFYATEKTRMGGDLLT